MISVKLDRIFYNINHSLSLPSAELRRGKCVGIFKGISNGLLDSGFICNYSN